MSGLHILEIVSTAIGEGNDVIHVEATLPIFPICRSRSVHVYRLVADVAVGAPSFEDLILGVWFEAVAFFTSTTPSLPSE